MALLYSTLLYVVIASSDPGTRPSQIGGIVPAPEGLRLLLGATSSASHSDPKRLALAQAEAPDQEPPKIEDFTYPFLAFVPLP